MKIPDALLKLLDDLNEEIATSSVRTISGSKAFIYLDEHAASAEDAIVLIPKHCKLLFDSTETVELLMAALGDPKHASIELHEIELSVEVLEMLEHKFAAFDEK